MSGTWEDLEHTANVFLFRPDTAGDARRADVFLISVRRRDGKPIGDWRTLQEIKNLIAGDDVTAVQVFPPAREAIDMANVYHLWCAPPGVALAFSLDPRRAIRDLGASSAEAVEHFRRLNEAMAVATRVALDARSFAEAEDALHASLYPDSVREP